MKLKYISAQPATAYYAWQVEVYLNNFTTMGIEESDIYVVLGGKNDGSFDTAIKMYPDVTFAFYDDTRIDRGYPPSIQPHILEKFFTDNQWACDVSWFYHDCDFIFTKPMDFSPYINDDKCYMSDTKSYMGVRYIRSKGENVLTSMCDAVRIQQSLVIDNDDKVGGAQKLIKGVDPVYWRDVFSFSNSLYNADIPKDSPDGVPIQIWTASMWAELWELWRRDIEVETPKEFDFAWATDPIVKWKDVYFFHNAGVVSSNTGMFMKSDYIHRDPWGINPEDYDRNRCSYLYTRWIENSAKKRLNLH